MRCKRTSKRRWKRRAAAGHLIPLVAIVEHQLERWFDFDLVHVNAAVYRVRL
jgi:hypothetical protein